MIFPPVIHGAGETSRTILLKYIFSTFLKEIAELRGGGGEGERERKREERREEGTRADSNGRGAAAPFIDNR